MAISRARKEELVAQYTELLENSNGFIIVTSNGLTVHQTEALRAKVREANGTYVRAKNTLFRMALDNAGWDLPDDLIQGPVNVAFSVDNFPGVAKAVLDYIGDREMLVEDKAHVTAGIMAEEILDAKKVEALSKLPSLDELRAEIAGLLVQPATGLVTVLDSATGQLVNVLQAYIKDREDGEAA